MLGTSFRKQQSFIGGDRAKYGTKGSVRPEYYNYSTKVSIELKNYELFKNKNQLVRSITSQANYRRYALPKGSTQKVYIDVGGQNVTPEQRTKILEAIDKKLEKGFSIDVYFVE